jgi:hypothetical protein
MEVHKKNDVDRRPESLWKADHGIFIETKGGVIAV